MLNWDVYGQEEIRPKLPRFFIWIAIAVYVAAFSFVLFSWIHWISLLMEYRQTLTLLVK